MNGMSWANFYTSTYQADRDNDDGPQYHAADISPSLHLPFRIGRNRLEDSNDTDRPRQNDPTATAAHSDRAVPALHQGASITSQLHIKTTINI